MRSSTLDDLYVCDLIERCNLSNLEKLLVVVPGLNNLPNILKLSSSTFNFVLQVGLFGAGGGVYRHRRYDSKSLKLLDWSYFLVIFVGVI